MTETNQRNEVKTIHKYPIKILDEQTLNLPQGAEIIHVGLDPNGVPCIWALVDPANDDELFTVYVFGTGNPFPSDPLVHLGSFVQGLFFWHVYTGTP